MLSTFAGGLKPVLSGGVHQIVFVEGDVADPGRFFQGVSAGTKVVLLDSRGDPLQQISHTLAGQHGLDAVQIVSHGRAGALELGATWLDQTALDAAAQQVASWGSALAPAGDLLLWGCDVASGPTGQAFVNRLAVLTGADVAASTDRTGSAAQGGDWNLEYHTGPVETTAPWSPAVLAKYHFTLPAPANDNVNNAEVIPPGPFPVSSTVTADITDATDPLDDPVPLDAAGPVSHSIWYTFTPTTTAHYTFTSDNPPTGTTVPDTVLGIFTGPAHGPYTEFASNNDDAAGTTSTAEADLIAGQQYWIVAWESGTDTPAAGATAVQLQVDQTLLPAAPANDTPAGAEVIPPLGPFPYQTAVTVDTTGATRDVSDPVPSCQPNVSKSLWYTFTPTVTSIYTFRTGNPPTGTTAPDTVLGVFTGGAGGPYTEVTCADDGDGSGGLQSIANADLTAGQQYWIVVYQFGTDLPAAGETAVQLQVEQPPPPANDTGAGAIPLTLNLPQGGTTASAHNDYQLPASSGIFTGAGQTASTAPGRDVVYSFTAPAAGAYSFRATGYDTAQQPVLYVAGDFPTTGPTPLLVTSGLQGANRTSRGAQEAVDLSLTAGQTVYVYVDDNNAMNNGSAFTVEVNPSVVETEPNDTPAAANAYTFGVEGSLNTAGDKDFFQLGTPAAGSRIFAMIDGVAAGTEDDFDLRVTTQTDTLEYDDEDAGSFNFDNFGPFAPSLAGTQTTGVATYLQVSGFTGSVALEPYRLYAVVQPASGSATPETGMPHDTLATAQAAGNNYFAGTLSGPGLSTDQDLYSFTAQAGDELFLSLDCNPSRGGAPVDAALELLDYQGNTLLASDNSDNANDGTSGAGDLNSTTPQSPSEGLVFRARASGTYYVRVTASPLPATNGNGDYLLSIAKNGEAGGGGSDTTAPTVSVVTAPTLTASGAHPYTFSVTYTDNLAVDPATFDNADLVVNGPNGYSQVATFVSASSDTPAGSLVATYRIPAPAGGWVVSADGSYTIHLNPGQVGDTAVPANTIPAGDIGNFTVDIDVTPPAAAGLDAATLTNSATNLYQFRVTFTDNVGVLVSSLGDGDVQVAGPNGFNQLATFVDIDDNTDGTPRTATYQITSPGPAWVSGDNGTYTVSLVGGEVSDVNGNTAGAATAGTFSVAIDTFAPTASGTFSDVTTGLATTYDFQVTYSDNVAIDVSTLDGNDVRVFGPNGFNQPAALVLPRPAANASPVTQTYRLTVPGGGWHSSDNGTYMIVVQPGQVGDTATPANFVAAGIINIFHVNVETTAPSASASAANVTIGLTATEDITVIYSDNVALDVSTLDGNDIRVLGPNNFDQPASFVHVDINSNGTPRTATYRLTVPGGGWHTSDNGIYRVVMQANQVFDTATPPNAVAAGNLATFTVTVDTTAPTASASAAGVTSSLATTEDITVTYSDNVAIDVSTLDDNDVRVTGPNGFDQPAVLVPPAPGTNGTPRTVTYRVAAPTGGWQTSDNGTYQVVLQANQVFDTATPANAVVAGSVGTFTVNVDTAAPTASGSFDPDTTGFQATYDFDVIYTDNGAIKIATLDGNDVQVTGPNGFQQAAQFVGVTPGGTGPTQTATYRITLAAGGTTSDNGTYHVLVQANQVSDTATPANFVAAGEIGTFTVNVDTVSPTASASLTDVTTGLATTYDFTVTYADNVAIDVSTLGDGNVRVVGPGGASFGTVTVLAPPVVDGTPRLVTYRLNVPNGGWHTSDNGTYHLRMQPNQVFDTATPANAVGAGELGMFNVNVDTVAPTAGGTFSDITVGFGSTATFTVTYTDNVALDVSSLDGNDVQVTGPNGFSQLASFVGVDTPTNGKPRTATYRITAPGGTWTSDDNGTYTVAVQPGQVSDTGKPANAVPAGNLGTFNVKVDTVAPAVTVTPQASPTNVLPVVFNVLFSEPVTGFSSSSVVVGGTAGATTAVVSGSGASYTVSVSGVKSSGTVILSLAAGATTDLAGNASLASATATATFNADVTAFVQVTPGKAKRRGSRFIQKVTLKNTGNLAIPAPLALIFDGLGKGVKLKKGTGTTKGPGGKSSPYVLVKLPGGTFAPGTSITLNVTFAAPSANKIKYKPRLMFGTLP